jgi:hypothetical protein
LPAASGNTPAHRLPRGVRAAVVRHRADAVARRISVNDWQRFRK